MPTLALMFLLASADFTPARLSAGEAPMVPPQSVDWGQAIFELSVAADGSVARAETLSPRTPFVDLLENALRQWEFTPAGEKDGKKVRAVAARVLVAGLLRPPELQVPAPAPASAPPTSPEVPAPVRMVPPPYPPRALLDGLVVVEVEIDGAGTIGSAKVVRSSAAFDEAALDAAREWKFQPAVRKGRGVPAYVYLVFGFRQPVITR